MNHAIFPLNKCQIQYYIYLVRHLSKANIVSQEIFIIAKKEKIRDQNETIFFKNPKYICVNLFVHKTVMMIIKQSVGQD